MPRGVGNPLCASMSNEMSKSGESEYAVRCEMVFRVNERERTQVIERERIQEQEVQTL